MPLAKFPMGDGDADVNWGDAYILINSRSHNTSDRPNCYCCKNTKHITNMIKPLVLQNVHSTDYIRTFAAL